MADSAGGKRQTLARWFHRANVLALAGRLRDLLSNDLRILVYHRVLEDNDPDGFDFDLELISASAADFRAQMATIRRDFTPLRFAQVIDCLDRGQPLPPRAILVTFDDGYDDNYRIAFPILRELGMSAMFFVSTGHIDSGEPYGYDWAVHMICRTQARRLQVPQMDIDWPLPDGVAGRREVASRFLVALKAQPVHVQEAAVASMEQAWSMPRAPHADCRPMSWDQLREMHAGGMEVGSHGVHHRMLAKMPRGEMAHELFESRRVLEAQLGVPPQVLSYPVGGVDAYDEAVMDTAREAGYRIGCSYVSGTNVLRDDALHALRRLHVERYVDPAWFRGMIEMPELFA